jgi:hypothetical protein
LFAFDAVGGTRALNQRIPLIAEINWTIFRPLCKFFSLDGEQEVHRGRGADRVNRAKPGKQPFDPVEREGPAPSLHADSKHAVTTIDISAKKVAGVLVVIIVLLTLASMAGQFSKYYLDHDVLLGFVHEFNLDHENNIPTWYSTVTLLFCSVLLCAIAVAKTREEDTYAPHWKILAFIFLLLSLDEAASLHEQMTPPVRSLLHISVALQYAWIIPGGIFVLVVGFAYLNFLRNLSPVTRRLFVLAGSLYVAGALGMEFVGSYYDHLYGGDNMAYAMIVAGEEFLEMTGVAIFLYALMSYLSLHVGSLGVRFKPQ